MPEIHTASKYMSSSLSLWIHLWSYTPRGTVRLLANSNIGGNSCCYRTHHGTRDCGRPLLRVVPSVFFPYSISRSGSLISLLSHVTVCCSFVGLSFPLPIFCLFVLARAQRISVKGSTNKSFASRTLSLSFYWRVVTFERLASVDIFNSDLFVLTL